MAFYRGPKIVTSGIQLYLDAADRNSYPGSGTTWRDLSSNGLTGTLTNGPTFSQSNAGVINFDSVDDYVENVGSTSSFSFIQNTGIYTISAWVKLNALGTDRYFLGNNDGTGAQKGFYLGYEASSDRIRLLISYADPSLYTLNTSTGPYFTAGDWINVTCVGNGTSNQFYKNGSAISTTVNFGTFSTGNSARTLAVGRINNFASNTWNGGISSVMIYNRALTASEVSQNFNAMRGRFGV